MSVVTVRHKLFAADESPVAGRTVTAELIAPAPFLANHTGSIVLVARAISDTAGLVELKLTPQLEIAASGTHYTVRVAGTELEWHCVVPSSGPVELANILVDPDTLVPVSPDLASLYVPRAEIGVPGGIPPLDEDGKVPPQFLPAGSGGGDMPDATTTTKGIVQLAGDLAGTAGAPTVPGLAGKYVKPGSGIPGSDLAAAVQASLGKADTATQPGQLATVATSGAYGDLTGKPSIPDSPDDIGAAPATHTHTIGNVTGLQTELDGKAATVHSHTIANVTGLQAVLDGKAATVHGHAVSDVSGLQTALDGKVQASLVDAAGDLLVGSGPDALTRLAKGADGQVLGVVAGAVGWVDAPAGGGSSVDPVARRYGCKAITMDPHDLSVGTASGGLKFIAMSSQRLYQMRVALPAGETVSSVRVPIKALGSGAGALRFGVYQEDLAPLGSSADVAGAFTTGSAETWRTAALTTPAATTGDYVWIVALSTLDTGPQLAFSEIDNVGEFAWLLNTSGTPNAVRTEGASALPGTLDPGSGIAYLDCLLGIA
jgi:hypothetical protein